MLLKVAIIGSGNWGTAIARIVAKNAAKISCFNEIVKMYVFEEIVDGKNLSEIINTQHENTKYLPGFELPHNLVAVPDLVDTAHDADIMIWVLPHKFVRNTCERLDGKIKKSSIALSLIKGFDVLPDDKGIALISEVIQTILRIDVSVMMGANLAGEVAAEKFSESTLASKDLITGRMLKDLMQTDYFRISNVTDISTVEVCGALKNVVAVGAGFVDGLDCGENTKAAVMRLGLMEMIKYAQYFFPDNTKLETFFQSCGVADLITTCYGGRNRKIAEAFVRTGKSMEELEKEMLNGQRMQGPQTAEEVFMMLKKEVLTEKFPLLVAVHRICIGEIPAANIIDCLRSHPML